MKFDDQRGFSLIEVIIVVALIAFVYTVALPEFSYRSGTEIATKLNTLASDFRNAYDQSVLTGKTYRFVFVLSSGEYWLEEADKEDILLGSDKVDRDMSDAEEKDEAQAFDAKFRDFLDLAGPSVSDPKGDREIAPTSPVLQAKDRIKRPVWTRLESMEWGARTLGPHLLIKDLQAEHHGVKQDLVEMGESGRAMIYVFPTGYIEKAVIHIAYKKDNLLPDDSKEPYTLTTNPYEGMADVVPGYVDVDVHQDKEN